MGVCRPAIQVVRLPRITILSVDQWVNITMTLDGNNRINEDVDAALSGSGTVVHGAREPEPRLRRLDPQVRVRGAAESWSACVAIVDARSGCGEDAWIDSMPEHSLTVRLGGAPVYCAWGRHRGKTFARNPAVTLQPRGTPNHYLARGRLRYARLYLADQLIDDVSDALRPGSASSGLLRDDLIFTVDPELDTRVDSYIRAATGSSTPSPVEMEARATLVVERLLRHHHGVGQRTTERPAGLARWQVRRVHEYLVAEPARSVSLAAMATLVGLSPFHFARSFKAATGLPPHRYHMMLRLERVKYLLATTQMSITAIGADVGYEDPGYLARVFRREFGVAPGHYRQSRTD